MEIEKFKRVSFTNSEIVNFLSQHAENEEVMKSCEMVLLAYCSATKDFMDNYSKSEKSKKDINHIVSFLQTFEKSMDSRFNNLNNTLPQTIADRVSGQVAGLMLAINQTVSSVMQKLDMDALATKINTSIQDCLTSSIKESNGDLEKEVKDYMQQQIIQPMYKYQEQIAALPGFINNVLGTNGHEVSSHLQMVEEKLGKEMASISERVKSMDSDLLNHITNSKQINSVQQQHMLDQIKSIPQLTKGVMNDVVHQLEQETHTVLVTLKSAQQQLQQVGLDVNENNFLVSCIKSQTDNMLMKQSKGDTHYRRGKEGEDKIFNLLSERLMVKDGFVLEKVCGQAHCCDIAIKREQYPTIRIECKAHGMDNNEKVKYKDIEKFQKDLLQVNNHGIMVSLYSGIVGMGNLEIQQLVNGKFAIYLANNNYDVDIIIEMLHLLYRLDNIVCKGEDEKNGIMVTAEMMTRIKGYLKDFSNKIQAVKTHMRESMTLLTEVQLDMIEKTLLSASENSTSTDSGLKKIRLTKKSRDVCQWCKKEFNNKAGLGSHMRTCPQAPSQAETDTSSDSSDPDA